MTQVTKKQHYVPQFYLRQWADKSGSFYPVKIEKKEPPKFRVFGQKSSPANFCFENFFYAQHTGEKDEMSQLIENDFADAEGKLASKLPEWENKIVNNEQITSDDKYHLSELMLFMWFRGKEYRTQSKQMTEKMIKWVNKTLVHTIDRTPEMKKTMTELGVTKADMIDFAEREEYTVDIGNAHHMAIMKDMYSFCNLLHGKFWRIYISRKGEFITTDAPYLDMSLSDKFWGNDFLSREQTFVLSPRVFIVARYPDHTTGKKIIRKDITNDKVKIKQLNCHKLMNSTMFGFHPDRQLLLDLEEHAGLVYDYYKPRLADLLKRAV